MITKLQEEIVGISTFTAMPVSKKRETTFPMPFVQEYNVASTPSTSVATTQVIWIPCAEAHH